MTAPKFTKFEFDVVTVNDRGQEIKRERSQAQYFTEDLGNGITLEMVAIPDGKFMMGSPAGEGYDYEKPAHEVTVSPFCMGKYPVTQAQWRAVCSLPKVERDLKPEPSRFKGDNLPVEKVPWCDAVEFCARLSQKTGREYRLPSEAEWEYACRAINSPLDKGGKGGSPFHFGETITSELANYDGRKTYANEPSGAYREQTAIVGSFPPNAFGLYDMHGQVWEWCGDTWHDNYERAPTDSSAWTKSGNGNCSPLRGGSWYDIPFICRSACRGIVFGAERDSIYHDVGFRLVCVVDRTADKTRRAVSTNYS